MNLAVVQHSIRETLDADVTALAAAIRTACERGAELVVCPAVPSIIADPEAARPALLGKLEGCAEGTALLIPFREPAASPTFTVRPTPLGETALLLGDECLLADVLDWLVAEPPAAIVMRAMCESELQAEGVLERAIALSASVSGLVVVAECDDAGFAEPGHGGSAVVLLGEIVAEAAGGDDGLFIDISVPVPDPEPRESVPTLPPILEQRVAHHQGRKPEVGYLADLS